MEDMSVSLKGYPGELANSSFLSYFVSVNSSPALPPSNMSKPWFRCCRGVSQKDNYCLHKHKLNHHSEPMGSTWSRSRVCWHLFTVVIAAVLIQTLCLWLFAEIHAALAAALYVDKHATVPAEQQFTIATLLDPRYRDLSWVRNSRHWPPSLVESLQKFILLR